MKPLSYFEVMFMSNRFSEGNGAARSMVNYFFKRYRLERHLKIKRVKNPQIAL